MAVLNIDSGAARGPNGSATQVERALRMWALASARLSSTAPMRVGRVQP